MAPGRFTLHRCAMAGVEAVAADTRHAFARHTHEQFGIGLVARGAQRSLSGRGIVEAGPGDIITVNPGEVHDGAPIGEAGRAWRMLYFAPRLVEDAAEGLAEGQRRDCEFTHPVLSDSALAIGFHRLFDVLTASADELSTLQAEGLFLAVLQRLLGESDTNKPAPVAGAIERARQRIDDEPAAAVTLADLARESGLSRFQVLRGFVRATGFTPNAYLLQRRTDLARRLIAGGTPLVEAAAASGFADQSHMTRVFVKKFGLTPGRYAVCA